MIQHTTAPVVRNTHRPPRFKYVLVAEPLIDDLVQLVERGESAVLFGPRGIGKQIVIAEVQRRITEENAGCTFVRLKLEERLQATVPKLVRLILRQLRGVLPGQYWRSLNSLEELTEALKELLEKQRVQLVFLVSNVDFLPDSAARQLLKAFRTLTHLPASNLGQFAVLLTGAVELASLVHGADSEFTVRDQFVVEGFGLNFFVKRFHQFAAGSALKIGPNCAEIIHRAVGGNMLLSRVVFDAILDKRRCQWVDQCPAVTPQEVLSVLKGMRSHPSVFRDVIVHPFAQMEGSFQALSALQQLLDDGKVDVVNAAAYEDDPSGDAPTVLELCGIARRQGKTLVFASPVVKSFTRGYFSHWTLGDAFAGANCWKEALGCYARAVGRLRPWVGAASLRPRLPAAVQAFETMLVTSCGDDAYVTDRLRVCLSVGARYLLGFDNVTFWKSEPVPTKNENYWHQLLVDGEGVVAPSVIRDKSGQEQGQDKSNEFQSNQAAWSQELRWLQSGSLHFSTADELGSDAALSRSENMIPAEPDVTNCDERTSASVAALRRRMVMNALKDAKPGINQVELADEPFVVLIGLAGEDGAVRECVLLDNLCSHAPLTRARRSMAESVLATFTNAFQQACRNQRTLRESIHQKHVLKTIPDVFRIIGRSNENILDALKKAGEELRAIGYHRVMFSLVNHGRRTIKGAIDCRPQGEPDIAKMTDFPLFRTPLGLYPDVQPACVMEGRTILIPDAANHYLTCKETVEKAQLKGIVLIPLKNKLEVLGTMHVEKGDKSLPRDDELQQLEYFAEQLTRAIDVAFRVEMLEDALQEERDAIVVFDHGGRLRFSNKAAGRLFEIPDGWQQQDQAFANKRIPGEILVLAEESRSVEQSLSRYLQTPINQQTMSVVHAGPLKDWRGTTIGTVVQIQDMSELAGLLKALKDLAACGDTDELAQRLMSALKRLGHNWGRLYLMDRVSKRLVGHAQFGLVVGSEGECQFRTHTVVLPERGKPVSTWLCFERKKPILLSYCLDRRSKSEHMTPSGLFAINVIEESCPSFLKKEDGDHWIDLPLISRDDDRELGKISIDCPVDITPAGFEIRSILAEAVSAALTAIVSREEREAAEANRQRQNSLKAIGNTCHQLASKLASLGSLGPRYLRAKSQDEIEDLNEIWNHRLAAIGKTLDETKLRLMPIKLSLQKLSLPHFLQSVFEEQLQDDEFELKCSDPEFQAEIDPLRMKEAINELIANARKAIGTGKSLVMKAEITDLNRGDVGMCRIDLTDNGPGIPEDRHERVFEAWFSEWADDQPRGTGLGLSQVQTVILTHRGTISAIKPQNGSGACFRIEFPRFRNGQG